MLLKLAKLMEENRNELAVLESLDSGKPIRECQTVDVPDTIHTIRWHAELIDEDLRQHRTRRDLGHSRLSCASRSASSAWCCRGTFRS